MTNPNRTDIVVIQDRSGSMAAIKADAEGGINTFIEDQKSGPGECFLTFTQFDTEYEELAVTRNINEWQGYELKPRGGTALLDAIGRTITTVGERLKALPEDQRPGKVYVVINTDGEENSSADWRLDKIKELITNQQDQWNWEFVFLAANQDAMQTGQQYGFRGGATMSYAATAGGTQAVYAGASKQVLNSRSTGAAINFTDEQREAAMDKKSDEKTQAKPVQNPKSKSTS